MPTLAMISRRSGPMTSAYTNGTPLDLGLVAERHDQSRALVRAEGLAGQQASVAADQHRRGDDHQETNEDRPNTVVRRDARQLVKRHTERGDDERYERNEILGEDGAQSRVRGRERVLKQIATEFVSALAELTDRLDERYALEHEGHSDDDVADEVV